MPIRVPDSTQKEIVMGYLTKTKKKLNDAQLQVASGRKGDKYIALAEGAGPQIREEALLRRTKLFHSNNLYVDRRLSREEDALKNLLDLAGKARRELVTARNGNPESINNADALFGGMLDQAVAVLNHKDLDGRYIFAGSRTDVAPVDTSSMIVTPPTGGAADTTYYQGDSTILTLPISEEHTLSYGILASHDGFEELLRGLRLAKTTSYIQPVNQTRVQDAMDTLDQAIEDMGDLLAKVGEDRRVVEDVNHSHEQYEQYLEEIVGKRLNVDFPEAISRVSYFTDQISASYFIIQRMNSLSLMNYLGR